MKTLIAALTLGTFLAAPAFAQSYDPDVGSGNLTRSRGAPALTWSIDQRAFAQVTPKRHKQVAAKRHKLRARRDAFSAYAAVPPSTAATTRETAIHDCAVTSQRYTETTWDNVQSFQYRACMMQHGQVE